MIFMLYSLFLNFIFSTNTLDLEYRHVTVDDVKNNSFIKLLGQLTTTNPITQSKLEDIFNKKVNSGLYTQFGCFCNGKSVGLLTVLYDTKYARGVPAAFIEDVVVDSQYRGKGICKRLLELAEEDARSKQAYKMILSCTEDLGKSTSPYIKAGYSKDGLCLRKNLIYDNSKYISNPIISNPPITIELMTS